MSKRCNTSHNSEALNAMEGTGGAPGKRIAPVLNANLVGSRTLIHFKLCYTHEIWRMHAEPTPPTFVCLFVCWNLGLGCLVNVSL